MNANDNDNDNDNYSHLSSKPSQAIPILAANCKW